MPLLNDLRSTLRSLGRHPGLIGAVVVTLALGMAANTAIFELLHDVLLEPLPFERPEELYRLYGVDPETGREAPAIFPPSFETMVEGLAEGSSSGEPQAGVGIHLAALVADADMAFDLTRDDRVAGRFRGAVVSASLFDLLGLEPVHGRFFRPDEDRAGSDAVAVLSERLWRASFGADPAVIGRTVRLNDASYRVIGIAPGRGAVPSGVDLWLPNPSRAAEVRNLSLPVFAYYDVLVRLEDGTSPEVALDRLLPLHRYAGELHPGASSAPDLRLVPLRQDLDAPARDTLLLLQVAVGVMVLICFANVAGLLLVRAIRRRGELALRSVLGARPGTLARQLTLEALVLFLGAALLGWFLAQGLLRLLIRAAPAGWVERVQPSLDPAVLAVALVLAVAGALVFGFLPATAGLGHDLGRLVHTGLSQGSSRRNRAGKAIVVVEVALAVALVAGALLIGKGLAQLHSVEPGFVAEDAVVARVTLLQSRYPDRAGRNQGLDAMRRALAEAPGVDAAGGSQFFFLTEGGYGNAVTAVDAQTVDEAVRAAYVTPGYFEALGVPVLTGEVFTDSTPAGRVVVGRSLAHRLWGSADPVGRRLVFEGRALVVLGVVGDLLTPGPGGEPGPELFVLHREGALSLGQMTFVVRSRRDPRDLASLVERRLQEVDPAQTVTRFASLDSLVRRATESQRYAFRLLAAFAVAALLLAALGIYSVLAYTVASRSREIGTRMALGARRSDIVCTIVLGGARLAAVGVVLGSALAWFGGRLLDSRLEGIGDLDAVSWLGAVGLAVGAALAATVLPARRAVMIDPVQALRE